MASAWRNAWTVVRPKRRTGIHHRRILTLQQTQAANIARQRHGRVWHYVLHDRRGLAFQRWVDWEKTDVMATSVMPRALIS